MAKSKTSSSKSTVAKSAKKKFRVLSEEEMVFGFGPKPTDEQLEEFFSRPDGKGVSLEVARKKSLAKIKSREKVNA